MKTTSKTTKKRPNPDQKRDSSLKVTTQQKEGNKDKANDAESSQLPPVQAGAVVVGRVLLNNEKRKAPLGSILVQFRAGSGTRMGKIDITQVQEPSKWIDNPFESFKEGQFVKCVALKTIPNTPNSKLVDLSLRPSFLASAGDETVFEKELEECRKFPKHDSIVTGYVIAINEKGCFVRTSRGLTGRVQLKNLAQGFVKDVAAEFPIGKLVAGRVLSVDEIGEKIELTLKPSAVIDEAERKHALATLQAGVVVDGSVHRIIRSGLLISLKSAGGLIALCHLKEVFDDDVLQALASKSKDRKRKQTAEEESEALKERLRALIEKTYKVGDAVKCLVLDIDQEQGKVRLGLKPSYFSSVMLGSEEVAAGNEDESVDEDDINASPNEGEDEQESEEEVEDNDNADEEETGSDDEKDDNSEESEHGDGSDAEENAITSKLGAKKVMTLQDALAATGVSVSAEESTSLAKRLRSTPEEQMDEGESTGADAKGKLNNKRKESLRRQAEATVSTLEDRVANDAEPENPEEFERALVYQSNSSLMWIKYISYLVSIGDVNGARNIGERALKTIPPENEEERNNIWSGLLTMELQFGTLDAAKTLFARMVRATDEKWAYMTLCDAYTSMPPSFTDRQKLAEEAIRGAKKASKQRSAKVWIRHFQLRFDFGDAAGGRKLLKEALRFLPSHKHIKVMIAMARLEFSHELGDTERARTIMEGILDNYPKRTDIWHVFIDMEIKFGDAAHVRGLFDRVLSTKLSTKKVKSLFKKWLQFESSDKGGGDREVELVKARARKYVSMLAGEEDEEDE